MGNAPTQPRFTSAKRRGETAKLKPAGEHWGHALQSNERIRPIDWEQDLDVPRRACAHCERVFQPTLRRRMLCDYCWRHVSTAQDDCTVGRF